MEFPRFHAETPAPPMLLVGFETGEIKDDRPNFVVSDGRRRQWRHHVATGAGDIEKFRGIVFKRQVLSSSSQLANGCGAMNASRPAS